MLIVSKGKRASGKEISLKTAKHENYSHYRHDFGGLGKAGLRESNGLRESI